MITATINGVTLQLHQSIQYKVPGKDVISDGKIEKFQAAPAPCADSIWAYVIDIGTGKKEWISLPVWGELYEAGAFPNMKKIISNASPESAVDDLPF